MIPLFDNIPASRFSLVNYLLIGANLAIFAYELSLGRRLDPFISQWAMTPALLTDRPLGWLPSAPPALATPFTSMFLHGGWEHVLGNMLFLWVFGDNVEDAMGRLRYLAFYLLGGLAAAAAQIVMAPDSPVPTLGASGAVSGVLGAYLVLYPKAWVRTLLPFPFFMVRVPALIFLGLWFLLQFGAGLASESDASMGGVAWWAHVGGFVAGMTLVNIFRKRWPHRTISY